VVVVEFGRLPLEKERDQEGAGLPEKVVELVANDVEGARRRTLGIQNLRVADQPDRSGVLGILDGRGKAAQRCRRRFLNGHAKDLLGDLFDSLRVTDPAGEVNTTGNPRQMIPSPNLLANDLEGLSQAVVDDEVGRLSVHLGSGHAVVVLKMNDSRTSAVSGPGVPFVYLEGLGTELRDLQNHGQITGDVIAADRHAAREGDGTIGKQHVVGRAATEVDEQGAALHAFLSERNLSRGHRRKHDVLDAEPKLFDAADRVLHSVTESVHDMIVGLETAARHADGIDDAVLTIDEVLADDAVKVDVLLRDPDVTGDLLDLVEVLHADHVLIVGNAEAASVVDASDMTAGDGQDHFSDGDITPLFGLVDGLVEAGLRLFEIHDFPLANARRGTVTHAEDPDAGVSLHLADDDADLGSADFESDVDLASGHG